ncbi:hypothetical protein [Marinobacterium sediminicola]|uniref:Nickel/cobalt transporter regulator n=1 Tax=Marinobacterium sediminicola TaxID=518898 RepID=A0ABY1RWH4_9GAMM|nr:hypothetical protein [Marinobacterium sediminicola]ULG70346.1 hypothetical protein LN244_05900 [Marinobacterium sediminicola]SMR69663.1 hypothetical protein SAMN04487964_101320 [Marinobacterium sediminicola]
MKLPIMGLALSLLATPALAQKPEWAGQPKEAREEYKSRGDHRDERQDSGYEYRDKKDRDQRDERYRDRDDRDEGRYLPLSDRERRSLRDWILDEHYGATSKEGKYKSLPPGLRKKLERGGDLPPGWQDKVRRGEVLDDDLYRQGERLPRHYLERLGHGSEAAELIILGDRIVRVAEGRGTVLDVIELTDKALEMLGN